MTAYTEGPWYIDGHAVMVRKPEREHLGDGAPETICEMISSVSPGETKANQVLIAAAPDLLEALQEAKSMLETASRYFPKSIKNAGRFALLNTIANTVNPAIAKATANA